MWLPGFLCLAICNSSIKHCQEIFPPATKLKNPLVPGLLNWVGYMRDKPSNLSLGEGKSIVKISKSLTDIKVLTIEMSEGNLALRGSFPGS